MKQKTFLASAAFIFLILSSSLVFACISFPKVETKNNCDIEIGYGQYNNESGLIDYLNSKKDICNLSSEDVVILKDFLIRA